MPDDALTGDHRAIDQPTEAPLQSEADRPGGPAAASSGKGRWLIEFLVIIGLAVAMAFVLRTFVVGTYSIPSGSMEPTLMIGDRIVVDKLAYHLHGVERSNIVVFSRPSDEDCGGPPVADLVKRVIGLPGETISLSGGQVYINAKLLSEPWLPASEQRSTTAGPSRLPYALHQPYRVPADDVFVMGDNRGDSCDSRYWGPIPESSIVGKVDVRIWPVWRLHWF
jgi:signal peptidase I